VLTGSVRQAPGAVRITARLVASRDGAQVWAERWDRPDADLFQVQDEIAAKVAEALAATLGDLGALPKSRYAPKIAAYDAYVAGRAKRIPPTPANLAAALLLFEEASRIDPRFAGGPAGASVVHALYAFEPDPPMSAASHLAEALRLGERATAIDADFGPAHGALGEALVRLGRHEEALAAIDRAIALAPADALMRATRGRFLAWAGEPEKGLEDARQALRMAPGSLPALYFRGLAERAASDPEAAAATLEEHRERLGARFAIAPNLHLLAAYGELGRTEDAKRLLAEIRRRQPNADLALALRTNPWAREADAEEFRKALGVAGLD